MKGFKNLKNNNFGNAKVYFKEYNKQSLKYSVIANDISLIEKSIQKSIEYNTKNESLQFLRLCRKIMKKYSFSENSVLSQEINKIDIFILTEKYEEAIKLLNDLIFKNK